MAVSERELATQLAAYVREENWSIAEAIAHLKQEGASGARMSLPLRLGDASFKAAYAQLNAMCRDGHDEEPYAAWLARARASAGPAPAPSRESSASSSRSSSDSVPPVTVDVAAPPAAAPPKPFRCPPAPAIKEGSKRAKTAAHASAVPVLRLYYKDKNEDGTYMTLEILEAADEATDWDDLSKANRARWVANVPEAYLDGEVRTLSALCKQAKTGYVGGNGVNAFKFFLVGEPGTEMKLIDIVRKKCGGSGFLPYRLS